MTRLMSGLCLMLFLACVLSLHAGLTVFGPATVISALAGGEGTDALIITTLRLPRTLIGLCTGAALGLSGLLMQSVTRNPLAEPGLLGVNAGAALFVTLGATVLGFSGLAGIGTAAMLGALFTTGLVFLLSVSAGGSDNPATTLLAGVTVAALFASFTQTLLLIDETALETLLFWLSGSFADRPLKLLVLGVPLLVAGCAGSFFFASSLDALRLDDASARTVGVNVFLVRIAALAFAALLAAGAVAMSGPVLFLGLAAPHLARRLMGDTLPSTRALIVLSMLTGALIAVVADILARIIVAPGEAPISAVLALVGVPLLVHLLRRRKAVSV
ncbi:iron ABC transporter permease [uncultured Roseibium sp.]|uniref:FecCD family ABC transporter permease n=1 Tax=uncultured Roseibium sp. TaxID=1936171 RepID=UPI0026058D6D|nr:iron ABC transporter permease [uncultured Roseibium sp.]